jgi:hypothetical protein
VPLRVYIGGVGRLLNGVEERGLTLRDGGAFEKVGKNIETLLRGWCCITRGDLGELKDVANARLN